MILWYINGKLILEVYPTVDIILQVLYLCKTSAPKLDDNLEPQFGGDLIKVHPS